MLLNKVITNIRSIIDDFNLERFHDSLMNAQGKLFISELDKCRVLIHKESIYMSNNYYDIDKIPHTKIFIGFDILLKKIVLYYLNNLRILDYLLIHDNYAYLFYERQNKKGEKRYFKNSSSDKRIDQDINQSVLKQTLTFYKNGYLYQKDNDLSVIMNREHINIQGHGFSESARKSFYEYLERLAASTKLKNTIFDNYDNLKRNYSVIHPKKLGLYANHFDENLVAYDDSLNTIWANGKSLRNNKGILIPEQYVQYLYKNHVNQFIYDNSNGCALGNSLEEATLFSLLELIERETFLNFWFNDKNLSLRELYLDSNLYKNKYLFFGNEGYELRVFLIKNNVDIPVVLAIIFSEDGNKPINCLIGTGAHMNILHAVDSSIEELYYAFNAYNNFTNPNNLRRRIQKCYEKKKLENIEEHVLYFASKEGTRLVKKK
ncbi:hypothetical protein BALCAV_0214980 [Alkalihalobacillus alcalophilus ATCC 27647 = CGMCC 1.3604]|nr:YcaO-like family protein [Alkalihalobacillus alcalophilus]KGA96624.1 hypothetical protein BALCAV_0214980 [Alkalihalobacillus alcalophilus ATCC 27647 = CGMCC 1.3604]